ncbi:hypothetical protein GIB67_008295 [Kingdonia uniflora]|uniref:DNA-directed primase/polymerase protein n=1 Tax=Kingdonia uniflora TaxID=39325 RepID=A0A7J7N4W5_9MAGN|nr:hypothetical protein GIB67_008295 [Kingdonia uniflora]
MDDVDRLFECFKCGVTPPESALRKRKKTREKLNKECLAKRKDASFPGFSPLESPTQRQKSCTDVHPKVGFIALRLFSFIPLSAEENKAIKYSRARRISPVVFYGSPRGVQTKKPTRLLQLLHEIHDDLSEENDLSSRKAIWATFPVQAYAIEFAKKHPQTRLFSYQDRLSGQRRFLVSTYKEFWRRYKNMDSRFRHHYEVIQEGLPCHLYFDLEFDKRVNVDKDGEEMVDLMISVIIDAIFDKYSIQGNQDWVIELDSSTEEKFSRHLIIRIPKIAFKDNLHVGAFVAEEICSRIYSMRGSDQRLNKLFVSKDSSSQELLFVDTAVYSRNRCFRLPLSSKAGKKSMLLPTGRFKCKNMCEEEMFMESLICKMDGDCQKLLICKMDLDCVKTLCFDSEVNANYEQCSSALDGRALRGYTSDLPTTYFIGKSPFPALDIFVEYIASTGNISGRIRSWYWFSEYGLMIYSMSRNRYCEHIGREHKSNHVMYVVDFRRAVYYQKCYDPDCKGYRSPFRSIPGDSIPSNMGFSNSMLMEHYMVMDDQNNMKDISQDNHLRVTDSCKKNEWWLEAIRIADDIECRKKAHEICEQLVEQISGSPGKKMGVELQDKMNFSVTVAEHCTYWCPK